MNRKIIASIGVVGSIASIIGLLYLFLPKEAGNQILQNQFGNNNIQSGKQVVVNNYTNNYQHAIDEGSKGENYLSILNLITLGTNKGYVESLLSTGRKESASKITYIYSKKDFVVEVQYDESQNVTYIKLIPKSLEFSSKLNIGRFLYRDKPLFLSKATIGDFAGDTIDEDEELNANSGGSGNCVNGAWFSFEHRTHRFAIPYPVEVGYQASDCMDNLDLGESNYIMTDKDDSLVHSSVIDRYFQLPDGTTKAVMPIDDPKMLLEILREVNINYIAIGKFRFS